MLPFFILNVRTYSYIYRTLNLPIVESFTADSVGFFLRKSLRMCVGCVIFE